MHQLSRAKCAVQVARFFDCSSASMRVWQRKVEPIMERELHEMDAVMGNGTAEGHGSPSPTYTRHQLAGFIDNVEFQRWLDRPATRPELLAEQVPLKRRPGRRRSRASTADDDVSSEDEQPLEPWGVLGRVRRTKAEAAAADHARAISAKLV